MPPPRDRSPRRGWRWRAGVRIFALFAPRVRSRERSPPLINVVFSLDRRIHYRVQMIGLASFADEWSLGWMLPVPPPASFAASSAAFGGGPTAAAATTRDGGGAADDDDAAREENARLRSRKRALEGEAWMWGGKVAEAGEAVSSLGRRIDALRNGDEGMRAMEGTLEGLRRRLDEELRLAGEYRDEFLKTHERTSGEIAGGRSGGNNGTALGPGHVVKSRREIQKMDSLEDYENYIEEREDALWVRIDALEDKIKKDSRREAIEW